VLQREVTCEFCDQRDDSERHLCSKWPSVDEVRDAVTTVMTKAIMINDLAAIS